MPPNSKNRAKRIIILLLVILAVFALFKLVIQPLKEKQFEKEGSKKEATVLTHKSLIPTIQLNILCY